MELFHALRRHAELSTLIGLGLLAGSVWLLVWLGAEVIEGDTHAFDQAILLAMRAPGDVTQPLGPPWVQEAMRDFTAFGGVVPLTLLTLASAGFLWLLGQHRAMLFLVGAVASGTALSQAAKALIDRPRPELFAHGSFTHTASFPSGHSMLSAVVYLTLAVMLARTLPRRRLKLYVVALAIALSLAVGISRVYLGVHWPSDVLAGWAAGAAWALACALAADRLTRRGGIEPEEAETPSAAAAPGDGPSGA